MTHAHSSLIIPRKEWKAKGRPKRMRERRHRLRRSLRNTNTLADADAAAARRFYVLKPDRLCFLSIERKKNRERRKESNEKKKQPARRWEREPRLRARHEYMHAEDDFFFLSIILCLQWTFYLYGARSWRAFNGWAPWAFTRLSLKASRSLGRTWKSKFTSREPRSIGNDLARGEASSRSPTDNAGEVVHLHYARLEKFRTVKMFFRSLILFIDFKVNDDGCFDQLDI